MPQKRRLDLPRLNAKTAHLNLLVRAPHKLQCAIPAPARQVPAAVHPTPRSTKPIRNKAPPSQTPATQITTRHTRSRNVKPPNNPNRHRLQTTIQNVHLIVGQRTTVPDQLLPGLRWRFPRRITDDDHRSASDERHKRLLNRRVESTRDDKGRSETSPDLKVFS